jgi:hypothetical protein
MPTKTFCAIAVLALPLAAACNSALEPDGTTAIAIDFCATEPALWFAYQNEGAEWTRVVPDADGTVRFDATEKVGIAYVRNRQNSLGDVQTSVMTSVLWTTAAQLEALNDVACVSAVGSRTAVVSIAGAPNHTTVTASAHRRTFAMNNGANPGTITRLPNSGALDFMATLDGPDGEPASVIIQRDLSFADGAAIPTFDFGSADAVALTRSNYTVTRPGGGSGLARVFFWTKSAPGMLPSIAVLANGSGVSATTFPSVPLSLTQPGDLHELQVGAGSPTSNQFAVTFFRGGSDKALSIGPALDLPVFEQVPNGSSPRFRVRLASQAEYGGMVHYVANQSIDAFTVTATADHFAGTPTEWDLIMPDFTGLPGWSAEWNLQPGQVNHSTAAFSQAATYLQPPFSAGADPLGERRPFPEGATVLWAARLEVTLAELRAP